MTKHEAEMVGRIVNNVLTGIRTKEDLNRCGCPSCRRAIKLLDEEEN